MRAFQRFEHWWFSEEREATPAIFRILVMCFLGADYVQRVIPRAKTYVERPLEFYRPVSFLRWLGLEPPGSGVMGVLLALAVVLLLASVVGFRTRRVLFAFALINLYVEAILSSWGYTAHSTALPSLFLLVLPFMPGVDELSLDALLRKRSNTPSSFRQRSGWAVRLCLVLMCSFYFASGLAKLRYAGVDWADGRTLSFYLSGGSPRGQSTQLFIASDAPDAPKWRDGFGLSDFAYVAEPTALGRSIASSPIATRFLAIATLLLELTFPLALVGRRFRLTYLAAGTLLHLGVMACMRIDFVSYLVCYTLFVNFRRLWAGWPQP